jgi:splicing factor 3A subunit 3
MAVREFKRDPKAHKDKLLQQHRIKAVLDKMQGTAAALTALYKDADGARRDEVAALGGKGEDGRDAYAVFYGRLKEIKVRGGGATS